MLKVILVFGKGQLQMLFFGAAALHDALQAASEVACVAAMQPMAQLGFWHELPAPTQQCPATLHLASQLGSSARTPSTRAAATVASRLVATIVEATKIMGRVLCSVAVEPCLLLRVEFLYSRARVRVHVLVGTSYRVLHAIFCRKNARIGLRIFNKCQDRSESEVLLKIVTLSPPDYRIQYCFRVPPQIQPFCDSPFRHRPYPSVSDPRSTLQTIPSQIQHFVSTYVSRSAQIYNIVTRSEHIQCTVQKLSFEIPHFSEPSLASGWLRSDYGH